METSKLIKEAVQLAKKKGFEEIKANCEDFETPTQFVRKNEETAFIPDATGVKRGKTSYFEIAVKPDDIRRRISKWKLLSTLAAMKGGKLFLLAPRGHKAFTERIVKKHLLNAEVIYLKNAS